MMGREDIDPIRRILAANQWRLFVTNTVDGKFGSASGYVNFICSQTCHMPNHFIGTPNAQWDFHKVPEEYRNYKFVSCTRPDDIVVVNYRDLRVLNEQPELSDKAIVYVNHKRFASVRKVIDHYATDREMGAVAFGTGTFFPAGILQCPDGVVKSQDISIRGRDARNVVYSIYNGTSLVEETRLVENPFEYAYPMKVGDCGTLSMSLDGTSAGKVIGAHFAGDSMRGFAYRITKDEVLRCLGILSVEERSEEIQDIAIDIEQAAQVVVQQCSYDPNVHGEVLTVCASPRGPEHTKPNMILFESGNEPYIPIDFAVANTKPSNYPIAREPYCRNIAASMEKQAPY